MGSSDKSQLRYDKEDAPHANTHGARARGQHRVLLPFVPEKFPSYGLYYHRHEVFGPADDKEHYLE